jgi:phi LC3 family holin
MQINWQIRFKNPTWWAQVVASIVMPLVVGMGYEWSDMTSWATLGDVIAAALGNPVICATMLTSLWAAITDPTTSGLSDSKSALERTELKGNYKKEA